MASYATNYAGGHASWTSSSQPSSHKPSDEPRVAGPYDTMYSFSPQIGMSFSDASSNSSRKRARSERDSSRYESTFRFDNSGTWKNLRHASDQGFGQTSPASFTNSTYRQQYDFATPSYDNRSYFASEGADPDKGVTQHWTSMNFDNGKQTINMGPSGRIGGKRARASSSTANQKGESWGSYVYNMVGGIAGKMIGLVSVGGFTGFTAGGGQGYEMTASGPRKVVPSQSSWSGARQDCASRPTLPGQYPEEDLDGYSEEEEEMRSAKRQQISAGNDWVVVDAPSQQQPRSSPSNYLHSASPRRPASRVSVRPAQPRRPRMSSGRVTSVSYTGSPQVVNEHKRAASFVTPRSPSSAQSQTPSTPPKAIIDADLAKYSAKKMREVRQSDASMSRLNSQLQAMIKQGKQALASTIEVQDHGDEEVDDDELVYEGFGGPLGYDPYTR